MEITIENVRKKITTNYQRNKKVLMKKELENYMTPTSDLAAEVNELKGYLRGLMKALEYIEAYQHGIELPLEQEAG